MFKRQRKKGMVDRLPFGQAIEGEPLELRRLTPVELLGIDEGFKRFVNPVGIFRIYMSNRKSKLLAIVEFDDVFDLSGNRFHNDG
jgi:hypothetical protein